MEHQRQLIELNEQLALISREVEASVAAGHYDLPKICEGLVIGLLRAIYGWDDLRNLNTADNPNFPSIDLADERRRIAVQVTATPSLDKVRDTLTTFLDHDLDQCYDRLVLYMLTKRQRSYSVAAIEKVVRGRLRFDPKNDILDFSSLAQKAQLATPAAVAQAVSELKAYRRGVPVGLDDTDFDPPSSPCETLTTNLLEVYFPSTLFVADLQSSARRARRTADARAGVRDALRAKCRTAPSDYVANGGQIYTFHDLRDQHGPFWPIIDPGTVTELEPQEYYDLDDDAERVFKSILRFLLQQRLYQRRVVWKHEPSLFVFYPLREGDNDRKETWIGKRRSTVTVFQRKMNRNDPSKVLSVRHLSFAPRFVRMFGRWYLAIRPDWYFSSGPNYDASPYGPDLLAGLKRLEHEASVRNRLRFWCWWLAHMEDDDLFAEGSRPGPRLAIREQLEVAGGRWLNDDLWGPVTGFDQDSGEERQATLDLEWR